MKKIRRKKAKIVRPPVAATTKPTPAKRSRIMIIDDHPMTRMGLTALINGQSDMLVCAEASDPATAQKLLPGCSADLVVADLAMPGRSGTELIKDLIALDSKHKILVLSMLDECFYGPRALRAGARGYVMKNAGGDSVLTAIRQLLIGGLYVSAALSGQLLGDLVGPASTDSKSPFSRLTDREFEVFRLIGQGNDGHEISRQLRLSPKTVDVYRGSIRKKLGLANSTALVHHAVRWIAAAQADRLSQHW